MGRHMHELTIRYSSMQTRPPMCTVGSEREGLGPRPTNRPPCIGRQHSRNACGGNRAVPPSCPKAHLVGRDAAGLEPRQQLQRAWGVPCGLHLAQQVVGVFQGHGKGQGHSWGWQRGSAEGAHDTGRRELRYCRRLGWAAPALLLLLLLLRLLLLLIVGRWDEAGGVGGEGAAAEGRRGRRRAGRRGGGAGEVPRSKGGAAQVGRVRQQGGLGRGRAPKHAGASWLAPGRLSGEEGRGAERRGPAAALPRQLKS